MYTTGALQQTIDMNMHTIDMRTYNIHIINIQNMKTNKKYVLSQQLKKYALHILCN